MKGNCESTFPHLWSAKYFILENGSYVYGESEFTVEESFLDEEVVEFF